MTLVLLLILILVAYGNMNLHVGSTLVGDTAMWFIHHFLLAALMLGAFTLGIISGY